MAALGGGARRFETGRAATDDQYALRLAGRSKAVAAPLPFPPRGRIDDAADPVVTAAPAPAHLVAGQAASNILRPAVGSLCSQMRIGDLPTHDGNEIGVAFAQHALGVLGRADMALGGDQ